MLFLFLLLAIIPVIVVMYFVLRNDRLDAGHRRLIWKTVFFGMLSVPTVLLVHYLLKNYVNIDLNLLTTNNTLRLAQFNGDPLAIMRDLFSGGIVFMIFLGVSAMASIEEISKALIVRQVDGKQKSFNRIIDGIEFSIAAALGFSFVENLVYFYLIQDAFLDIQAVIPALILRAIVSTAAHIMFSAIFGYYYAKARFFGHSRKKQALTILNPIKGLKVRLTRTKHFLQGKNLHIALGRRFYQDELIAEGLLIASILHAIFNFVLTLGVGYLVVPLIVIEYAMIAHEFHVTRNFEIHEIPDYD